jgi:hypothetical protein
VTPSLARGRRERCRKSCAVDQVLGLACHARHQAPVEGGRVPVHGEKPVSAYADELSDEAKAWLAVKFAQLHEYFPPVRV